MISWARIIGSFQSRRRVWRSQILDIYGFAFDSQVIKSLKKRVEMGQIRFMVYDDAFQNYYLLFPKFYRMHLSWVMISTIFVGVFITLTVLLILYTLS